MKHLQIGDVYWTISGMVIYSAKVNAIAIQPDGEIIYNWMHRQSNVYASEKDAIDALEKQAYALIDKLKNDLKKGKE